MVKIKLLLGLGTTAVVWGAGTAVYFGIENGTDEEEKKGKERDKVGPGSEASGETPPTVPETIPATPLTTPTTTSTEQAA